MSSLERRVVSLHGGSSLLAGGAQVSGRYIVQASLGRGGMAAVYRAFDPKLSLEVALKVLPPHLAVQPTFLSRFRREGQTLAKLNHPHILRLYEIGEDPASGLYYLVLELLGGGTLKQRLRGRPWSVGETVDLLRPVAAGLDAVGIIAYELLTGSVPFQGDTPLATRPQVVSRPLPLPRSVNRDLSPA